jgi:hypothetical protein
VRTDDDADEQIASDLRKGDGPCGATGKIRREKEKAEKQRGRTGTVIRTPEETQGVGDANESDQCEYGGHGPSRIVRGILNQSNALDVRGKTLKAGNERQERGPSSSEGPRLTIRVGFSVDPYYG